MTGRRQRILTDIMAERGRQDDKWGVQRHDWAYWSAILAEEMGEVCREAIAIGVDMVALRKELIHVAAVAVAILEHVDEERAIVKDETS